MKLLKEVREKRGVSQRELAARSGLSFGCVQRLEQNNHNWQVDSIRRVGKALNMPRRGIDFYAEKYLALLPDSVEEISLRMHEDGFAAWPTHLFNFVDRFRAHPSIELIHHAPIEELDVRLRALIASTVENLCTDAGRRVPDWCRGVPGLASPWFVAGVENLKAMALVESPAYFRKRNIFVLDNFLHRA